MVADSKSEKKVENENSATDNKTPIIDVDDPIIHDGGYDLYPHRKGSPVQRTWFEKLTIQEGREDVAKLQCEKNVYNCVTQSPLVKLMLAALKSSGCEIDIRRHISCEICDTSVTGGFDPVLNQVVICQNTATNKGTVQSVLTHEMIHMFDYCRNEMDFRNNEHLACSEIRAANLAHCSFLGAMVQGLASPFNVSKAHQECVKDKAIESIVAVRKMPREEARQIVDRVFLKCYADLEPIGRRLRRNSDDMSKAYAEGHLYGYEL